MSAPQNLIQFEYFKIITTVGEEISIDPADIISLDVYESIDFPGITGTVSFRDWRDLKDNCNIFAGDTITFKFIRSEDLASPLDLSYVIYSSYGDIADRNRMSNDISFDFCSPWLYQAFTRKRSRSWVNKSISEIVTDLIAECSGELDVEEYETYKKIDVSLLGWIEETDQYLERFVSPYWSPIEIIQYLMRFAVSKEDKMAGYVIWTDIMDLDMETEIVNFVPVSKLMTKNDAYAKVPFSLKVHPTYQQSFENLYNIQMEQSFDVIKYAGSGLGRSKFVGFDYDSTTRINSDRTIDGCDQNHLSTKLPLNKDFLGEIYRPTKSSFLYPNTTNLIMSGGVVPFNTDEIECLIIDPAALVKGWNLGKMSYMFSDMFKLNVRVNGETESKRAGSQIEVVYPSVEANKKNEQYSGTYLIRNNRHTIQGMNYINTLTLIADGYKNIEREDMVEWGVYNVNSEESKGDYHDTDYDKEELLWLEVLEDLGDLGDIPWEYEG